MFSILPNIVASQLMPQADVPAGLAVRNGGCPDFSEVFAARIGASQNDSNRQVRLSIHTLVEPMSSPSPLNREAQPDSPAEPMIIRGELRISEDGSDETAIPVFILVDLNGLNGSLQPLIHIVPDNGSSNPSAGKDAIQWLNSFDGCAFAIPVLFSESNPGKPSGAVHMPPELLHLIAPEQGAESSAPLRITIITDTPLFHSTAHAYHLPSGYQDDGQELIGVHPAANQISPEQMPGVAIEFQSSEGVNLTGWGVGRAVLGNGPGFSNNAFGFTSPDAGTSENGQQPMFGITGLEGISSKTIGIAEPFHIPVLIHNHVDPGELTWSIVRHARFLVTRGESSATIRLEPPSLGRLKLEIITENANITARITVENREVRDLIQSSLPQLRESLTQNGLNVNSFDVLIGQKDQTGAWAGMDAFRERMDRPFLRRGPGFRESVQQVDLELMDDGSPAREVSQHSRFFDKWI